MFFIRMMVSTMNTIMHTLTMQQVVKAAMKVAFCRVFVTIACPYKNRLPMEETIRQAVNDVCLRFFKTPRCEFCPHCQGQFLATDKGFISIFSWK
jgi:hypothetical protein